VAVVLDARESPVLSSVPNPKFARFQRRLLLANLGFEGRWQSVILVRFGSEVLLKQAGPRMKRTSWCAPGLHPKKDCGCGTDLPARPARDRVVV